MTTEDYDGVLPVLPPDHEGHRHGLPPKVKRTQRLKTRLGLVPTVVSGISLTNYSIGPAQKGWGAHCTPARATITLSNGVKINVAARIALLSTLILNECLRRGYVIRQADTGAYNCRYISGTTVWSNHAWALAIDVNWSTNPYTTRTVTDKPQWLFDLFNRYGFANGADYSGARDWMHHEFMGSPAQADAATQIALRELGTKDDPIPEPVPTPTPAPTSKWHDVPMGGVSDLWGQGEQVRKDQFDLNDTGFPCEADGFWGPSSVETAKRFQAAARIGVDGEFGPQSREAIHGIPSYGLPPGHVWGPLTGPADEHGGVNEFERDHVQRLQAQLVIKGFAGTRTRDPSRTTWDDGRYEGATTNAVKRFQRAEGLAVDGLVGPATWTRLFR